MLRIALARQMVRVDPRATTVDAPPLSEISRDQLPMKLSAVAEFQVVDAAKAALQSPDLRASLGPLVQGSGVVFRQPRFLLRPRALTRALACESGSRTR